MAGDEDLGVFVGVVAEGEDFCGEGGVVGGLVCADDTYKRTRADIKTTDEPQSISHKHFTISVIKAHSRIIDFFEDLVGFEAFRVLHFVEIWQVFLQSAILAVVDSHVVVGDDDEGFVGCAEFGADCR